MEFNTEKLDLESPHVTVIIEGMKTGSKILLESVKEIFKVGEREAVFYDKLLRLVVVKKLDEKGLDRIFSFSKKLISKEKSLKIGIGRTAETVKELEFSYKTAELALGWIGEQKEGSKVSSYEKMKLIRLLSGLPIHVRIGFVKEYFKTEDIEELEWNKLENVNSFIEEGFNAAGTAIRTNISRKKVHRLVDEYSKDCGADLSSFSEAVEFKLGYILAGLLR